MVRIVASDFAERHDDRVGVCEIDCAGVEKLALVWAAECSRAGIDRHRAGSLGVPPAGMSRLLVDEMHRPVDIRFGIGDLLDRAVVVMRVDTESRCLTFDPALRILEAASWSRMLSVAFGPDEELVRTVADSCDADGRMNLVNGRHIVSGRDWAGNTRWRDAKPRESNNDSFAMSEQPGH